MLGASSAYQVGVVLALVIVGIVVTLYRSFRRGMLSNLVQEFKNNADANQTVKEIKSSVDDLNNNIGELRNDIQNLEQQINDVEATVVKIAESVYVIHRGDENVDEEELAKRIDIEEPPSDILEDQ